MSSFKKIALTGAESFWYIFMNIFMVGFAYLCKVPVKKALVDFGYVAELTGAEGFWYVVMNIVGFGSGYFAKCIIAKGLSEMPPLQQARAELARSHAMAAMPQVPERRAELRQGQ
jgi:hypothetical protein